MKVPVPPLDWHGRFQNLIKDFDRFNAMLYLVGSDQRYLPWDELRYRTPPDGMTVEEWWTLLKFRRNQIRRPLPLLDKHSKPFHYALIDRVLRDCETITRRASGHIQLAEGAASRSDRDRYIYSSLIEEAITSSQMEGAATTSKVAKEMIRTGRDPRDRDERMIMNNYLAMLRIREIQEKELTPELILELHRIVTDGTLDDPADAGRLQSSDEPRIAVFGDEDQVLHRPPAASELPSRLQALCDFANAASEDTYIPPVARAVLLHFMIGYDHYFVDGNGRTARAIFYWCLLHNGYWLAEYITVSRLLKRSQTAYVRSFLLSEDDDGDLTYFLLHHLQVIIEAIDDLDTYLRRKIEDLRNVRMALGSTPGDYNHRQLALLDAAMKEPATVFTVRSHARSHASSEQTARNDLYDLEERGLLARAKIGRSMSWTAVPTLEQVLLVPASKVQSASN